MAVATSRRRVPRSLPGSLSRPRSPMRGRFCRCAAPRALAHCVEEPGRAQLMGQARRNCCRNLILLRREKTREAARVKPGTALLLAEDAHDHRAEHIEKRLACALAQACEFSNRSG